MDNEKKSRDKVSVLIVDDDSDAVRIIKSFLRRPIGVTNITIVHAGQDAIDVCRRNYFDIVFMDITMPEMSGIEAAGVIHTEYPTLPIIAHTAGAYNKNEYSKKQGFSDVVLKPTSIEELNRVIDKFTIKY